MFVENFSKFIRYYGQGRKLKMAGFFLLSLAAGALEFVGIALVYPFILLIIKPESVIHNRYYVEFSNFFHMKDILMSAFVLGLLVAFLFFLKNLFMIFILYLQNKFVNNWKQAISTRFMHYYLFSPYKSTLNVAPSEKLYNLGFLVDQSIDGFIFRIISLGTNIVILCMILGLLFIKFPFAALITMLFVFFTAILQGSFFKNRLAEVSQKFFKTSVLSNEKAMECINNLKEIKVLSAEDYFYKSYFDVRQDYNKMLLKYNFYAGMPPYVVEIMVVFALVVLAGLVSLQNIGDPSWMIASYAIIVAAIFRIAPALNRAQSCLNVINSSRDFVKTLLAEYEKCDFEQDFKVQDSVVEFKEKIWLRNIDFAYKKSLVIKDLSLEIKKGEFIGIIGLSGAGKSTLADILMGLLPVDSGKIFVDEAELTQRNFAGFRKLIGYVPQQINILDGSFKRNVAWGVAEEKIDDTKVVEVLKKAQLYDFVTGFEGGIDSNVIVGSTGLSQGQKQRLAIARALYSNPQILIFDEATSSLDMETEYEITKMLNSLKGEKTIIAIAHRLSTLKSCDRLVYLKGGRVIDTGTFEELSNKHIDFEKLIKLSNLNNK